MAITIGPSKRWEYGEKLFRYMPQATIREGSQEIEVDGKMFLVNFTHIPSEDWYIGAILGWRRDRLPNGRRLEKQLNDLILWSLWFLVSLHSRFWFVLMRPLDALNQAIQDVVAAKVTQSSV